MHSPHRPKICAASARMVSGRTKGPAAVAERQEQWAASRKNKLDEKRRQAEAAKEPPPLPTKRLTKAQIVESAEKLSVVPPHRTTEGDRRPGTRRVSPQRHIDTASDLLKSTESSRRPTRVWSTYTRVDDEFAQVADKYSSHGLRDGKAARSPKPSRFEDEWEVSPKAAQAHSPQRPQIASSFAARVSPRSASTSNVVDRLYSSPKRPADSESRSTRSTKKRSPRGSSTSSPRSRTEPKLSQRRFV